MIATHLPGKKHDDDPLAKYRISEHVGNTFRWVSFDTNIIYWLKLFGICCVNIPLIKWEINKITFLLDRFLFCKLGTFFRSDDNKTSHSCKL